MTETVIDGTVAIDRPGYRATVSYGRVTDYWAVTIVGVNPFETKRHRIAMREPI